MHAREWVCDGSTSPIYAMSPLACYILAISIMLSPTILCWAQVVILPCVTYALQVHKAWQQEQLVPPLHHSSEALPGGYSYVAMDMLDDGWIPLYEVSSSYSSAAADEAKDAARQALAQAHKIVVKHGDVEKPAVHGDCRGPNIMVRQDGTKWAVRFVDLDWAGLEGVHTYPPRMSRCIQWHKDAKPRAPLRQEHDVHLLDTCGTCA